MTSMLNVQRLRLLVELADRGTIAAVADALHYTASTVSEGLAVLEREVGVSLLVRAPRSVRLTAAGEELAARGRELIDRLEAARRSAVATDSGHGTVRVATFPSAGATFVAHALARLREHAEAPRLEVIEAEREDALSGLAAGLVDLAIIYVFGFEPVPAREGIVLSALAADPIDLCLPPGMARSGSSLADLSGFSFAAGRRDSPCHTFTRSACRAAGFDPDIAYESDDVNLTCALVNAGLAAALLPRAHLSTASVPVAVADPPPALPARQIQLARRAETSRAPWLQTAAKLLAEAA